MGINHRIAMQNSYDAIAEEWHASRAGFAARKYVDLMLGKLRAGASVLDVGCGTGVPIAQYLVQKGFRVVGADQSARMLEIARRVVPEAELIQANMCELNLDESFDAAVVWDSIFHVERARHQAVFENVHRLLAPGGRLLLSAGGTGHKGFTSEMFGHKFFYSGYAPEETLRLLRAERFEIELWEEDDPSSRGHIAIIANKGA